MRRIAIAVTADALVVVLLWFVHDIARADRSTGAVPMFVAGFITYLLVLLWLYHRDAMRSANDGSDST